MYSKHGPKLQQIPVPLSAESAVYTQRLRDAFRNHPRRSVHLHDADYGRCDYAAIEKRVLQHVACHASVVAVTIEDAIARARLAEDDVPFTFAGVKVRVFPSDEPSDVRHRLRAEFHDQKVAPP